MKELPCHHCSTPFLPTRDEGEFCCAGCRFVNQLLMGEGLEDFYRLKGSQTGRPVQNRPFEPHQLDWLDQAIASLPQDEPQRRLRLRISGMTCVGCVWLIEKLFLRHDGAVRVHLFPATAEAEFVWEKDSLALIHLAEELPRYGYAFAETGVAHTTGRESKRLVPRLGLSAAFAMNTMTFTLPRYLGMDDSFPYARLFDLIALTSATFALLIGGTYFFKKAWTALTQRSVHMDLPISLGLLSAYLGSIVGWIHGTLELYYFDFVALFATLMLGGRYLHLAAAERSQSQLLGQSALPENFTLADDKIKATNQLTSGDILCLHPGQALPVAARLTEKDSEFSLAWMTGEPEPKFINQGSLVPAGAVSLSSEDLHLEAQEDYRDSLVARLMTPTTSSVIRDHRLNRILTVYLITILLIGIVSAITWLALGHPAMNALQAMISIFVISCPCAIGIAIPLVDQRASSTLADEGVFIQRPQLWRTLTRIKNVIFDKTGTLTLETPKLENSAAVSELSFEESSALHDLTLQSLHPLSRALHQRVANQHGTASKIIDHPGLGSELIRDGHSWTLGKPGWCGLQDFHIIDTDTLSCELACDGKPIARFHFNESLRPRTVESLAQLQDHLSLHILSGDQKDRVRTLATELNIPADHAHGALTPDNKQAAVSRLRPSLYLGDGMNDRLAFHASDLTGTPVADRSVLDQSADFLFTCSSLTFLPHLFKIAHWRRRVVTQIVTFSISYNIIAIGFSATGHMNPLLAAILMPISSIVSLLIARSPVAHRSTAAIHAQPLLKSAEKQIA